MLQKIKIDVILLGLLFFFAAQHILAAPPTFTSLTEAQTKTVIRDFATSFTHTSVTAASGMTGFGIELGALGGLTQAPGINDIVQENYGYIPHAGLIGVFYLPAGLMAEYLMLPKTVYQGISLQNNSIAIAWSPTSALAPNGFLTMKVRGFYGDGQLNYSQTVSGSPVDIKFRSISSGGDLSLGLNIPFFEPYISAGYIQLSGKLRGEGSASIFNSTYTTAQEAHVKLTGLTYGAGFLVKLPLLVAGAEYSRVIDDNRLTVKLALQFSARNSKNVRR